MLRRCTQAFAINRASPVNTQYPHARARLAATRRITMMSMLAVSRIPTVRHKEFVLVLIEINVFSMYVQCAALSLQRLQPRAVHAP